MFDILNITNGDYFNEYFLKNFGGVAVPFCEAMMDGDTVLDIYSDDFIKLRSNILSVDTDTYKLKMYAYDALGKHTYTELRLWFGKDTFCQANLLTLLAYLEQIGYGGRVVLNYIDDENFEVLEENIPVKLGMYTRIYEDILIKKERATNLLVLDAKAIDLYFDYHSDDGALARLIREHPDKDDMALLCLLLENSKSYGLSDLQAERLISRYKNNLFEGSVLG